MASKFGFIFLVLAFTTEVHSIHIKKCGRQIAALVPNHYLNFKELLKEISFTNGWMLPTKTRKLGLTEGQKKEVRDKVAEFINLVTLNETTTFWDKTNFHDCFNKESYLFNVALLTFKKELVDYLNNYWHSSRYGHGYLINEIISYITYMTDLMEKVRNIIYLKTQETDFDSEKLKQTIKELKNEIENCFILIKRNFWSIQKAANSNEEETLSKAENKFKTEVKNVKNASIQFVEDMKKCMKI